MFGAFPAADCFDRAAGRALRIADLLHLAATWDGGNARPLRLSGAAPRAELAPCRRVLPPVCVIGGQLVFEDEAGDGDVFVHDCANPQRYAPARTVARQAIR